MLDDLVLDSDDGDFFGFLNLVAHFLDLPAADGAETLVFGQSVGHDFNREIGLAPRAVATMWFLLFGVGSIGVAEPFLRGVSVELLLHRCELFFEEVEFHLGVDVLAPQSGNFNLEFCDLLGLSNGRCFEVALHHAEETIEAFSHVGGQGVGKYTRTNRVEPIMARPAGGMPGYPDRDLRPDSHGV